MNHIADLTRGGVDLSVSITIKIKTPAWHREGAVLRGMLLTGVSLVSPRRAHGTRGNGKVKREGKTGMGTGTGTGTGTATRGMGTGATARVAGRPRPAAAFAVAVVAFAQSRSRAGGLAGCALVARCPWPLLASSRVYVALAEEGGRRKTTEAGRRKKGGRPAAGAPVGGGHAAR